MKKTVFALLLAAYVLLSCRQVSIRTYSDLGRHLTDGALLLSGKGNALLHTNFYSYAQPNAPFVNHHWLASILFYAASSTLGMSGLNACYVALGALAFLLYLNTAEQDAGLVTTAGLISPMLLLMAARPGIRPEIFSVFCLSIFVVVIRQVRSGTLAFHWVWALPVVEVVWVNLHPGFILGPSLLGAYLLSDALARKLETVRRWLPVLLVTSLAGLLNPNGIQGLLFPFTVSNNYAMPVRENMPLFQLQDSGITWTVEAVMLAFLASTFVAVRRRARLEYGLVLFTAVLAGMNVAFFRVHVFFGYFALLAICANIRAVRAVSKGYPKISPAVAWSAALAALCFCIAVPGASWRNFGIGLVKNDDALANVLRDNQISGRVFNGYSSGGYLIYHFPAQKVFIDSRPEAYPADFIREEYLEPLADEAAWRRVQAKYNFEVICFAKFNADEAQFLERRVQDPDWAHVYNGPSQVLVRRQPRFQHLIAEHEVK
jgi:hypothetical protein